VATPEPGTRKPLSDRFTAATAYALAHHREQRRKGSEIPYAAHLLAVTAITLEMGSTEDEAIAALLHDVIEDGGGAAAEAEIASRFGTEVAAMVRANSDTDVEPKPPWRARKEAYIAGIATKSPGAVRVSIADKLHNARSIVADRRQVGEAVWDRFSAGRDEVLWYYGALLEAFESRRAELGAGTVAALDELGRMVEELRSG
jgi:(p)ppGpp synthase/HD superfamily hydrolase